ncbi:MAG: butyrate kinase [Candidatus Izemoplasmatales bacterium]
MMDYLILVINPGSTSTKVAIYNNEIVIKEKTLRHDVSELKHFKTIIDQRDFRKNLILDLLHENGYNLEDVDVFVGRGGMMKPLSGGTYLISQEMVDDLASMKYGAHASALGSILAFEFAKENNKKAFTVNPVVVDEFEDISRISGLKQIERKSVFHALNHKAIAMRFAGEIKKPYEDINVIVVHLGGGISVGLHKKGRVIDVNNALGGDGPFSPERTGTIPTYPLVDICFSGDYTKDQVKKMLVGKGGIASYLETNDARVVEKMVESNDEYAKLIFDAMAYSVVKEIGSMYFAAGGEVEAVLLTGGIAYSKYFTDYIKKHVEPIVKVKVYPGEDEMQALVEGAIRVLSGEEKALNY